MTKDESLIVIDDFGSEWVRFDQSVLTDKERTHQFNGYFSIFPWNLVNKNSIGFDLGCGSGRWALLVAPRVGHLHCIDPSTAINVAQKNLVEFSNCSFHKARVVEIPLADNSMDFGYSLGVLHHIKDTQGALKLCVDKLKPSAPFLIYLYYAFDNQPVWYHLLWRVSDIMRRLVCHLPHVARVYCADIIAATVYFPFAMLSRSLAFLGIDVKSLPLSAYRYRSFYSMRTDSLDRFGTTVERRFTKDQITQLMKNAGLKDIFFSNNVPYWCAVGYKA